MITCSSLSCNEIIAFFQLTKNDFSNFLDSEWSSAYAEKLSRNARFICCRNEDGNLVAMIAAYFNRPPLCYISHVSVQSEYKRLGVFSAMYNFLESEALEHSCHYLRLEVRETNISAINAYCKFGFISDGKSHGNNLSMVKRLDF